MFIVNGAADRSDQRAVIGNDRYIRAQSLGNRQSRFVHAPRGNCHGNTGAYGILHGFDIFRRHVSSARKQGSVKIGYD